MRSTIFVAIPIMIVLTVLQTAVLSRLPILNVVVQLPFLVAVAWGLLRGPNEGVIWAFFAGLFIDLFTIAPAGGTILTYMTATLIVSFFNQILPANRFLLPLLMAGLATLIQQLLYLVFLRLFGYGATSLLVNLLLPTVLVNGVLILPVYWSLTALDRVLNPRVVEI